MHKDMDQLYQLQQTDTAIAELEADRRGLDDGTALRVERTAAEAELAQRQDLHSQDLASQRKREADLERTELKRKQLMDKAYGGAISNPKELETLEKEIASLSRTKDRIETELLALFDQVDEEGRRVEQQVQALERLGGRLDETVRTCERRRVEIAAQIAALRAERETLVQPLDPAVLRKYESLRERCANLAVVPVENRACTGCRVGLPVVQLNRLVRAPELQQCESCLRLLWAAHDDEDE